MSCPTILLVAGSFGLPELYDGVVRGAASKGIEVVVPRLPSVGLKTGPREGELPTMYDDAALIAREIGRLADSGKDVVVVSHSYGGVPATESVKGLTKDQRRQEGKKGGVVRLAYMTALVAAVGMPAMAVLHDVPVENRVEMDADVSRHHRFLLSSRLPLALPHISPAGSNTAVIGKRVALPYRHPGCGCRRLLKSSQGRGRGLDEALPDALVCQLYGGTDTCRVQRGPGVVPHL